ncbi:MAG: ATP-binding protein [Blastocatellia bacterium]
MTEPEPERLEITIGNASAEIGRISEEIDYFVVRHGLPDKIAFELNLAIDEILANIISHGYDDPGPHAIELRCALADGEITLEVEDGGRAFNPFDAPPPDLTASIEDRPIGGLGVHIVRTLMDHVEYRRRDEKNIVILRKKLVAR